jgi:tetratricopeptide (TPR) repeat protein
MNNLANCYDDAGRREEALKLREELVALRRKVSGPEDPYTVGAMYNLAESYAEAGRRDEALKLREQVLALSPKVWGSEHPQTLSAMDAVADSYQEAGRQAEALKLKEQVLALRLKVLGPENLETLTSMNSVALIQAASADPVLRNGTNAVNLAETAVAGTQRTNAAFLDTLAAAYAEAGQFDKAVAAQQQAIGLVRTEKEKADYAARLTLYQANKPYRVQTNP